jgi:hypothetical protein
MPKSTYPLAPRPKARFAGLATILWSLLVVAGCAAAPSASASSVADGPKRFAVGFAVSPSSLTSCAENGSAGTTTYVYGWNGSKMSVVPGSLPSRPKVIVGTPT